MKNQAESQAEIKIAGRNINNLRYVDDTTLMAESEEELKSLLIKVKESEKAVFKLNIQKTVTSIWSYHFMANRWGKMERVMDLIFSGFKSLWTVTAAMKLKDVFSLEKKLWPT